MNVYYSKKGKVLGRAWSIMECGETQDPIPHIPHVWDSKFTLYGPYLCPGNPPQEIYDTKERKPL